jgi:integrase
VEFGPKAFKAIRQTLIDAGHSRPYINKLMPVVTRAFKWAAAEELVPASIYHALRTVEGLKKGRTTASEPEPVKPVDDQVVEATLPHLPPIVADMVRFERLVGCRPGEVCQLRPLDVDRNRDTWAYRPTSHKTEHHDRERVIFIGPKAQAVLLPYLLRAEGAYCFSPSETEQKKREARHATRKTPANQGNRPGTNRKTKPKRRPRDRYTKDSYNKAIQRGCEIAFGMPKELRRISKKLPEEERKWLQRLAAEWRAKHCWSPNQLRHAAGTEVRRKYGLEAAQVVLGHAKADVTQVYAERDLQLAASVMREVG